MAGRSKNPLGQYWTPRPVADLMVGMLTCDPHSPVLEPSSGAGVFLDALVAAGRTRVTAVEVDPAHARHTSVPVTCASFVTFQPPQPYAAVIGNPPYIRWRDLDATARREMQAHPLWGGLFNSMTDYLTVFIAASVEHLAPGGELVFITPSFWMHTKHSAPLRDWLLARGAIRDIVEFGETRVFPGVSSSIVVFRYVKGARSGTISLRTYTGPRSLPATLDLADPSLFASTRVPAFRAGSHWTLASKTAQRALDDLEASCTRAGTLTRLGDLADIANGMVSGLDKAFRVPDDVLPTLTAKERSAVIRAVKAKGMSRLVTSGTHPYVFLPRGLSEATARRDYPHLLALLDRNRTLLDARYRYPDPARFWEWSMPRSQAFHFSSATKVFIPCKERLTSKPHPRFTLAPAGAVATQDVTAFAPKPGVAESAEYLAAWLTLPEVTAWVKARGLMKGGVAEFSEAPLAAIPVRRIDFNDPGEAALHARVTREVRRLHRAGHASDSDLTGLHQDLRATLLP